MSTNSTRHKSRNGETHEEYNMYNYIFSISDNKKPIKYNGSEYYTTGNHFTITQYDSWSMIGFLIDNPHVDFLDLNNKKENGLHNELTDATNIEVFHLDTKDNGDKTAFIGFKIKNGNFSFVEVPFTSPKISEKQNDIEDLVYIVSAKSKRQVKKRLTKVRLKKAKEFNTQSFEKMDIAPNDNKDQVLQSSEQKPKLFPLFSTENTSLDYRGINKFTVDYLEKELYSGGNTNTTGGIKETKGKLDYSEINFKLLDLMAKRFMDNKAKYPKGNTKKDLDKKEILWAAFRHIRKMIQPIENDPETFEDHLVAVATNMSIVLDQLENNSINFKNNLQV